MSENIIRAKEYEEDPAYVQLREVHNLETYDDYAGILKKMSKAVVEMLNNPNNERDAVEIQNLNTLAELLPICSDLFLNCDEYWRAYKH